ncbi:putative pectin lyase F-1 [Paramyrothecium foliicola]|nr:putative pectin lyase F-1 [Paramyrothecium foliicola]
MRSFTLLAAIAAATTASAQAVVGTAYGFASGVTGGGSAAAAAPSSAEELAEWLSDDTARTIVIDKEYDFTGQTATGAGCDRKSCSSQNGGQLYLGDLSCGGDDNVAVSSITYDEAGTKPLAIGSNKSIIGSNGKGVIKGKGLQFQSGASNIILQGVEITNINPGIVWGGDALDFKGGNDGVWVDHCKISLVGRMFIVSHYEGSRITISNNEFDGVTTTSASCNDDHYWTMMFIADGDQITLDKNHFHDVSGRAPKLGADGVKGTFQASNNYFSNMQGHAFDAYNGVTALLEGNVFESVKQPMTDAGAKISTIFTAPSSAAQSCESFLGRACAVNNVDSGSGKWPDLSGTAALDAWSNLGDYIVEPVAADEVINLVTSSAGPGNLGSSAPAPANPATPAEPTEPAPEETEEAAEETPATEPPAAEDPAEESPAEEVEAPVEQPPAEETPVEETPVEEAPTAGCPEEEAAEEAEEEQAEEEEQVEEEAPAGTSEVQQWGQCGGNGYSGSTKCAAGTSCVVQNPWYSQCLSSAQRRQVRSLRHE